jgi:hypothetical protein
MQISENTCSFIRRLEASAWTRSICLFLTLGQKSPEFLVKLRRDRPTIPHGLASASPAFW